MAHAVVAGKKHLVRVVQDLTDNWSLEVYPEPDPKRQKREEPFKNWPVPICLKLRADSREHALEAGLNHLKTLGKIDEFHISPDERPKTDAPAKPKDDEAEDA